MSEPENNNVPTMDFSKSVQMLYPTPVIRHHFDDLDGVNAEIRALLLTKEKEHPEWRTGAAQKSNVAGWRSRDDLLKWEDPNINKVVDRLVNAIAFLNANRPIKSGTKQGNMDVFGWANINRTGQYNTAHIHPGYHWGAVYYVTTGKPDETLAKNGMLEFHDPRPVAAAMSVPGYEFGNKFDVKPKAGTLVVFPAWLTHAVHPFFGEEERISIAFNVRVRP